MGEGEVKEFGKHIVADPRICHGQLTFRGTRILVETVLEQVSTGREWKAITNSWGGKVPVEAITEAVLLARDVLLANHKPWRKRALSRLATTA